jgi:peptidoglycan/xylan/chitin deacetylase (PgdA/CDA1 family)
MRLMESAALVRRRFATVVKRGLLGSGVYRWLLGCGAFEGVAVLCYHGVRSDEEAAERHAFSTLHVTESQLDRHLALLRSTCHPLSLDEWLGARRAGRALPRRPVLVTFDDGYRSVYRRARPLLLRHGVPALCFVCSRAIAERNLLWFDAMARERGEAEVDEVKRHQVGLTEARSRFQRQAAEDDPQALVTVEELRRLAADGFAIGGHTGDHLPLASFDAAAQREFIASDREALTRLLGRSPRAFAYPNGRPGVDFDAATQRCVAEAGYEIAFSTEARFAPRSGDRFSVPRFLVTDEVDAAELAHRLALSWAR